MYILSVLKKINNRGLEWFYNRLILELRVPETFFGKKLRSINVFIYGFFSRLCGLLNFFRPSEFYRPDTLYVFYDLEVFPVTFNFCETLCVANEYGKSRGLKYLYIIFVPGPYGGVRKEMNDYELIIPQEARLWRKHNLLITLTRLFPSCIGFSNCSSRKEAEFIRKQVLVNTYPKGYSTMFPLMDSFYRTAQSDSPEVMAIRATSQALHYVDEWLRVRARSRKMITITFRHYNYMPKRNSNIEAWVNFATSLDPNQYFVVIVPDTEMAMSGPLSQLKGFEHFIEACWNVELRAALYESAYLNLGINNGPFVLCWLNKLCRYIMFKIITEEVPQTTEEALRKHGLTPGQNPSFALEYQKWVWEPDTEAVLQREFKTMCGILEKNNSELQFNQKFLTAHFN